MDRLNESIMVLKGIGSSKAKKLSKLGIKTIGDLLHYYPKRYKDKRTVANIKDVFPGGYFNIKGTIKNKAEVSRSRKGMLITKFIVYDDTGFLVVIFYNNRFAKDMFKPGDTVIFSGKASLINNRITMECPEYEKVVSNSINNFRIVPEYGLTEGLSQKEIRKLIHAALEYTDNTLEEIFPADFRKKFKLAEINFSIRNIHFPEDEKSLYMALRRMKFQEVLFLQSYMYKLRGNFIAEEKGIEFKTHNEVKNLVKKLP